MKRNSQGVYLGDISKTVGKSKSVIHCILRKLEETWSYEAQKPHGRHSKITAREDRLIGNESKRVDLRQKLISLKEVMQALT